MCDHRRRIRDRRIHATCLEELRIDARLDLWTKDEERAGDADHDGVECDRDARPPMNLEQQLSHAHGMRAIDEGHERFSLAKRHCRSAEEFLTSDVRNSSDARSDLFTRIFLRSSS